MSTAPGLSRSASSWLGGWTFNSTSAADHRVPGSLTSVAPALA